MKVSRQLIESNVTVQHYFTDMNTLYSYYINYPSELIAGIYCAVGGDPTSTDYTVAAWNLMLYDGITWIEVIPDSNYALVVTNEGIKALTNAVTGGYQLYFSEVKILSDNVRDSVNPLIYWTDEDFMEGHTLEYDLKAYANPGDTQLSSDWLNRISYNTNLTTGGLQVCLKLLSSDLSISNASSFWIQTIGLYVQDRRLNGNGDPVLFGIVALPAGVYKTVDVQGFGNELIFYINTVLDNLGTVIDFSFNRIDCSSLPERASELLLPSSINATTDNFNAYLVQNLNGSETPALAIKQFNPVNNDAIWRYIIPSENAIIVNDLNKFASDVSDYMFVAYDPSANSGTGQYVRADGNDNTKTAMGVRVGNTIVYAGTVYNFASQGKYLYNVSLTEPGTGYLAGDTLNVINSNITIRVTSVDSEGRITGFDYSPRTGPYISDILNGMLTYVTYSQPGYAGSGAKVNCNCVALPEYDWTVHTPTEDLPLSNFVNQPLYIGSGIYAGKLTSEVTRSFIGWCLSESSIRLGLDTRTRATETEYGTVIYANDAQVKNPVTGSFSVATPENIAKNYIISNDSCTVNGTQNSQTNRATVSSYLTFTHSIECTGTDLDGVGFKGTAYRALWGDLAEYYHSDKYYPAGTLIIFGAGAAEITLASSECDGIISERPGFILGEKKSELDLPVALCGKVPVLFDNLCSIHCGDKVYLSSKVPGKASTKPYGKCLGRVIDSNPNGKVRVMCVVNINF